MGKPPREKSSRGGLCGGSSAAVLGELGQRCGDVTKVGLRHRQHLAHATVENRRGGGLTKTEEHAHGDVRRDGQGVGVGDDIDQLGARRVERVGESVADQLGVGDACRRYSHGVADGGEVNWGVVRLKLLQTGDEHLELYHAERGVIEHDDLHRDLVEFDGEQLAEQHTQAAVTADGDGLAAGVGGTHRMWQGVRHGAVPERAKEGALARHVGDVPGGPHVVHARVDGEDGVVGREIVEDIRRVLRVDGGVLLHAVGVRLHDLFQERGMLFQHLIQEAPVGLFLDERHKLIDGDRNIAHHGVGDLGAPTDSLGVDIHLSDILIREEVAVGEIGTEHDEEVGGGAGLVAGAVAQQAAHAHVVGVIVLDKHLAAEGMSHRGLHLACQLKHLLAGVHHAATAEQGDGIGLVNSIRQVLDLVCRGYNRRRARRDLRGDDAVVGRLLHRHIAGDHEDGHAMATEGGLQRVVQDDGTLLGGVRHLAVAGALREDLLGVRLLEVMRPDLTGGDVGCQGENLGTVAVRIVQTLDEVGVAGAARGGAYAKLAGS